MEKEYKSICWRCDNYQQSPSGTTETCWAKFYGSRVILNMTPDYIEKRMYGDAKNCKEFKKITTP